MSTVLGALGPVVAEADAIATDAANPKPPPIKHPQATSMHCWVTKHRGSQLVYPVIKDEPSVCGAGTSWDPGDMGSGAGMSFPCEEAGGKGNDASRALWKGR